MSKLTALWEAFLDICRDIGKTRVYRKQIQEIAEMVDSSNLSRMERRILVTFAEHYPYPLHAIYAWYQNLGRDLEKLRTLCDMCQEYPTFYPQRLIKELNKWDHAR